MHNTYSIRNYENNKQHKLFFEKGDTKTNFKCFNSLEVISKTKGNQIWHTTF